MSVKKWIVLLVGIALAFCLAACGSGQQAEPSTTADSKTIQESGTEPVATAHSGDATSEPGVMNDTESKAEETMHLFIGNTEVSVAWEVNESVSALIDLVKAEPLIIDMSMYGGFEQVGSLRTSLPRNDKQTTTEAGDIVLYSGNQIVVFYGSNSWSYTRLGRITDKTAAEMADLLSNGNVTMTISYGG